MKRVHTFYRILAALLAKPWRIKAVLEENTYWEAYCKKHFQGIHSLPSLPFSYFNDGMPQAVEPYAFLEGGSLPTDLSLLVSLAGRFPSCRYFEIGTWRGESVANVARVASECITVNLSKSEILKQGYSEEYADAHRFFSRDIPHVKQIESDTRKLDFQNLTGPFDLIFIDGDHHFDMVKHDTQKVFKHLLHGTSVVVWHDYAQNPEMPRHEVLAGILSGIPESARCRTFHVANTLCAVYLPEPLQGSQQQYPVSPKGYFRVDLHWKDLPG